MVGPDFCIFKMTNRSCLAHQLRIFFPKMYTGMAKSDKNTDVPPKTNMICSGPAEATQGLAKLLKP